ncbi:hypothetical protein B0T20DRAFT_492252 [Sordaria brevicollis]|uniref:Uncharacterized protein n=1 Tax=Sordaria brevicollis TaxID=83679 RepID=A0AAE0PKL0_SORBR|nr:hypothetical protein B0T20DRAFT_492252 [Sordaria brevicollis]
MPPQAIPGVYTGAKRRSLAEEINNLSFDDEAIFKFFEEIDQISEESEGFRWHAVSTQKRQDRARQLYINMLKLTPRLGRPLLPEDFDDLEPAEQDKHLWPMDEKKLHAMGKIFIIGIGQFAKGRSHQSGVMSYSSYAQYRDAFMFWAHRTWNAADTPTATTPQYCRLKNKLTAAMRLVASKGMVRVATRSKLTYCNDVGMAELQMLVDYDLLNSRCKEVAEVHHLAWALGRICCFRPGSIGYSTPAHLKAGLFMKWRDVTILRGSEPGKFEIKLLVRSFKTNNPHDAHKASHKPELLRDQTFNIMPARNIDDMFLSAPHRFIAMAIRRRILKHYKTVDELFDGDRRQIMIKDEYLDCPVFLAAKPKGEGLTDQPVSTHGLSAYLKLRGIKVGLPEYINFYSLRRRSANELAKKGSIGIEAARLLLNHDPETRTLERYYIDPVRTMDVSALAFGHEPDDERMATRETELALNVLSDERKRAVFGPLLNATMNKLMASDPGFPKDANTTELRNYKRRVRWAAIKSLFSQATQQQLEEMTSADEQQRIARLKECSFTNSIIERAKEALANAPNISAQDDANNEDIDMGTGLFKVPKDQCESFPAEPDAESREENEITCGTEADESEGTADGPDTEDEPEKEVEYVVLARTFVKMLLEDSVQTDLQSNPVPCRFCIEDDTIPEDRRNKLYRRRDHLEKHEQSDIHTPFKKWMRLYERNYLDSPLKVAKQFPCPYCKELGINKSYASWRRLLDHLELDGDVNPASLRTADRRHRELQDADGWLDEDFFVFVEISTGRRASVASNSKRKFKRLCAEAGISVSDDQELATPINHEWNGAIVRGGNDDEEFANTRGLQSMVEPAQDPGYPIPNVKRQKKSVEELPDHSEDLADFYFDSEVHEKLNISATW